MPSDTVWSIRPPGDLEEEMEEYGWEHDLTGSKGGLVKSEVIGSLARKGLELEERVEEMEEREEEIKENERETVRWLTGGALFAYMASAYYSAESVAYLWNLPILPYPTNYSHETLAMIGLFGVIACMVWSIWPIWSDSLVRLKKSYLRRRERGSEAD